MDRVEQAEVGRLWGALLAGGGKPARCGWLNDRCGVSWQVVPSAMLADPDPARAARVVEALLGMAKLDAPALRAAFDGRPPA